jgi:outer membrane protein OmpA-like peptidoglycan-associated protein
MGSFTTNPKTGKYQMVLPPDANYQLELIVNQSKYIQSEPHVENFYIPAQCEAYNLFQQIEIGIKKDENGINVTQQAIFRHAMFNIDMSLKENYNLIDFEYAENTTPKSTGITGNLAHSKISDGEKIELMLLNEKDQIIRITRTKINGDFTFENIDTSETYHILVNQEDAIASYNKGEDSHPSQFYLQGILYNYSEKDIVARNGTKLLLAGDDRILTDMTFSNGVGEFEFKNPTTPLAIIEEMNDNVTITYNLDQSDPEIMYAAFITSIDPDNNELGYTERIDFVELQELVKTEESMQEFANILFDFDKFFLRQKSQDILESLYQFMKENPSVEVKLDGHTDWLGTDEYNEALSKKRALSAHKYLIDKGIAPNRIENLWFGESRPAVANTNPDGTDNEANRQLNRRVEIKVEIPELADLYLSL